MKRLILVALLLAGCSGGQADNVSAPSRASADLEKAAIARGLIRDPKDTSVTGLYAQDTDRICIVPSGYEYHIGVFVDYGGSLTCSGTGKVTRAGDVLHIDLGAGGCSFDARFDGDRIMLPGELPSACTKLCVGRASMAGVTAKRLSESLSEATTLRDGKGRRLCPTDDDK